MSKRLRVECPNPLEIGGQKRKLEMGPKDAEETGNKRLKKATAPSAASNSHTFPLTNTLISDAFAGLDLENALDFGPDTSRDRVLDSVVANAPTEQSSQFKKDRADFVSAARALGNASVKPLVGGMWDARAIGMDSSLFTHQVMGSGRALKLEKAGKGVLLLDQPGLGKTLQILTAVASSRQHKDACRRSTLVVVPPNTYEQWMREIKKHCSKLGAHHNDRGVGPRIFLRDVNAVVNQGCDLEDLSTADIVLTTTTSVTRSFQEQNKKKKKKKIGMSHLHQAKFFRICLDEAHIIRNDGSEISKACRALDATHHWAITGTPLINGVDDLFAILDFIGHDLAESKKKFKSMTADVDDIIVKELKDCTIRRTYSTVLFGGRLLNLPKVVCNDTFITFEGLEAKIYRIVHARFASHASDIADSGEKGNRLALLMDLETRPRQLASHPIMLEGPICDLLSAEDHEELRSILDPTKYEDESDKCLAVILVNIMTIYMENKKNGHPRDSKADQQQTRGVQSNQDGPQKCVMCKKVAKNPQVSSCEHIYCAGCFEKLYSKFDKLDMARCCKRCKSVIDFHEHYIDMAVSKGPECRKLMGKLAAATKSHPACSAGKLKDWKDQYGRIHRSAKVREVVKTTKNFFEEDKAGKTNQIVFPASHWEDTGRSVQGRGVGLRGVLWKYESKGQG